MLPMKIRPSLSGRCFVTRIPLTSSYCCQSWHGTWLWPLKQDARRTSQIDCKCRFLQTGFIPTLCYDSRSGCVLRNRVVFCLRHHGNLWVRRSIFLLEKCVWCRSHVRSMSQCMQSHAKGDPHRAALVELEIIKEKVWGCLVFVVIVFDVAFYTDACKTNKRHVMKLM